MAFEYICLTLMTILFMFAWLPGSIGKRKSFGDKWLASNRDPIPGKELLPWAARCDRAYHNLKDYFPGYAVAIILLGTLNKFDPLTQAASALYLLSRVAHFISYAVGNVPQRALYFFMSLACNLYLLIRVIS